MERISLKVDDGSEMSCVVSFPKTEGVHPGLIVFQEAFGVNNHIQDLTRRFAEQGFVAIAPELYHRSAAVGYTAPYDKFQELSPHLSQVTPQTVQLDAKACMDWLQAQAKVSSVSAIGYCMGGRAAFIANSFLSLKSAVSYYGGRINALLDLVPAQKSPLLFFWGGKDKHIPPEQIQEVNAALRAQHKNFTCVEISEADHGFFCEERPSYNQKAARESWALTLEFLRS